VLIATSAAVASAPLPAAWVDGVFLGCWVSVGASLGTVHLPGGLPAWVGHVLALNAGLWCGAVIAVAGSRVGLLTAVPCVLAVLPASWIIGRGAGVVVKVVSSWLIAVAALAVTLQCLPVTPGYVPDHLD